jgi:pyruvate/2-oxoglutarate dehydrogenase complex dihydrolipoamide acyltransferase (E2) component
MNHSDTLPAMVRQNGECQPVNTKTGPYRVINLPPGRRALMNALRLSAPTQRMYGLLEVDVTVARQFIAEHKARTGEALSFTGFLVFCLARAVEENKEVQAYLKGRRQIIIFDDVNVAVLVEHTGGEKTALMGHVIQGANRKTYRKIHEEIRSAQSKPALPSRGVPSWFSSVLLLPWPLSGLFKALLNAVMRRDPTIRVSVSGTVFVTAVGMFGKGHSGWGIAPTPHSLGLVVGSMAWKPAIFEGRIEPREILNLTVLFDHDVVDGAPATRFVRRLAELIQSGYGLDEIGEI